MEDIMAKRRNIQEVGNASLKNLTNGPVKLCEAMNIDKSINGINLCGDELFILEELELKTDEKILTSSRINIDYAEEYKSKPWRFTLEGNEFLSKKI